MRIYAAFALVLLATGASATDWSGSGANSNWSTPGNWVGGVAPSSDDFAVVAFGVAGTTFTPFTDAPWRINRLDAAGAPFYNFSGNMITFGGVAPELNTAGGVFITNALEFVSTVTVGNAADLRLASGLSGAGGLVKTGPGRLIIASPTMYTGSTTVSAGILQFGEGGGLPGTVPGPIVNNATVQLGPGGPIVLSQGMSGSGTLTALGSTVTSGAPFSHAGATNALFSLIAGQFPGGGALTIDQGRVDAGGGSVFASLTGDATSQFSLLGGTITVGADNASTTFGGALVGAGDLVKVGSGRLWLSGNTFHNGSTTIGAGILRIGDGVVSPGAITGAIVNDAALEIFARPTGIALNQGTVGSGSLTVLGGLVDSTSAPLAHTGATTVNAGGILFGRIPNGGPLTIDAGGRVDLPTAGTVASLSGAGELNHLTLIIGGNNASTAFTGPIVGGFTQKVGSGRLTLAGPTVHFGPTDIVAGTLRFGDGVTAPAAIAGAVSNNGALEFQATTGTTLAQGVSGSGTLRVLGGPVTIAGLLTQSGATFVDAGILSASFGGYGPLSIAAGARVNATVSGGVSTLTGAGQLDLDFNGTGVGWGNASSTFGGVISGAGGIYKTGTGTFTFSGSSSATGISGVLQGTLLLTGSMAGPMQVVGGTFGGTGTVSGPVTVAAGATLAPGLSPGVINTGSLNLGGIAFMEIEGTTLGTQYDNINVTGSLTISGSLTLAGAYVPVAGDSFTLVTNDGVDPVVGTFAGLPEGATIVFNATTLTISYVGGTGNDVVLAFAAAPAAAPAIVPTLSQWALILLAAILAATGATFAPADRPRPRGNK